MTPEEIQEGNKLIAEFMGYKLCYLDSLTKEHPYYNHNDKYIKPKAVIRLDKGEVLEFHSSWDWLMPVVEKIESIMDVYHGRFGVHIVSNDCTIQSTRFRPDKKIPDPPYYFNYITLDTKIESTWLMVVRFIKWYNIQKDGNVK